MPMLEASEHSDRWMSFKLAQAPPYEIGAWLSATLAYPEPDGESLRIRAFQMLAGSALRLKFELDPAAALRMQRLRPILLLTPPTSGRRYATSQLEARLKHRLEAAVVAGPMISRAIRESPTSNATDRIQALLKSKSDFADQSPSYDSANFVQRHFKPTIPVMHLAVAVALLIQHRLERGTRIYWPALLVEQELIKEWLESAEALEPVALKCWPKLRPENQYRFRLGG
jgi:hypothetical protein